MRLPAFIQKYEYTDERHAYWHLIFALSIMFIGFYLPFCWFFRDKQLLLHTEVLANTAKSAYQYQQFTTERIFEFILRIGGLAGEATAQKAIALTLLYWASSFVCTAAYFTVLFRICQRFVALKTACYTCLFYIILLPMMWWDNYYHPGDAPGMLCAALALQAVLDDNRGWRYLATLFISSIFWEKLFLFPLVTAALDLKLNIRPKIMVILTGMLGVVLAVVMQVIPRIISGTDRPYDGTTLAANLAVFPIYLLYTAILYGIPVYYLWKRSADVPLLFRLAAWQIPTFLLIYLYFSGILTEMRATMVLLVFMLPITAMALGDSRQIKTIG